MVSVISSVSDLRVREGSRAYVCEARLIGDEPGRRGALALLRQP
jgi:hypothetical protein